MLRYAYFQTIKGAPTLLIWGSSDAVARLYEALVQRADGEGPDVLTDIAGCRSVDGSSVLFETVGESEGLLRDEVEPEAYRWRMDRDGWYEFAEQVEPLTHGSPGHQYLRSHADDDIVVLVSSGEYPDDLTPSG
jgi:hypothetical protein